MRRIGEISKVGSQIFIENDDASEIKILHTSVWNQGGDEVIRADTRSTYRESNTLGKQQQVKPRGRRQSTENLGDDNNL